jgi:hypothetical protein
MEVFLPCKDPFREKPEIARNPSFVFVKHGNP